MLRCNLYLNLDGIQRQGAWYGLRASLGNEAKLYAAKGWKRIGILSCQPKRGIYR